MKTDYKQLYRRDATTGKIIIEIALNDYMEFFHEWDNAVFKKRDMHPELAEFLVECSKDIPHNEPLDVRFYLAGEEPDAQKEETIRTSYNNYYAARIYLAQDDMKRTVIGSGALLILSLILLFAYTLLKTRRAYAILGSVLLESLLIGGWVLTWEAFHRVAIDMIEPLGHRKTMKRLQKATIGFRYETR